MEFAGVTKWTDIIFELLLFILKRDNNFWQFEKLANAKDSRAEKLPVQFFRRLVVVCALIGVWTMAEFQKQLINGFLGRVLDKSLRKAAPE